MSELPPRQGPLSNIRVLDLGVLIAGPLVSCFMGDLGADVVKVERPAGDPCRLNGRHIDNVSLTWKVYGRNKRTIAIDFSTEEGRTQLLELIAKLQNNPGKIRFTGRAIDADRESILSDWLNQDIA
jgi:crotonobetainyl-CoA:carnitine CoA-transferase CaiB-like acyl-CoA transferase